ncbi:TetR/AcrR family transcriptional regulator [Terriglobus albidus]|uniref:TetR/AcrR family transcriptional regulator n=1 Tax=Terriglobus albidus TaxID=1592106 RepID=A0A5B9EHR0_9BACT|nr:TetR/AcrR family transcriptional regulator [Terriglobus albidus]QEE29606.1 TetR/AcrR family transcriptional regulator [Terriglobus albidus]
MAGRPREFDRDIALRKARDLFWERGYEGVSMSDLTAKLGLASARIYAAFGSKEALFREAVALYEAQEGAFAAKALSEACSVSEAIKRLFIDAIDLYTRKGAPRGCMVVSSATNCSNENDSVREWLAGHRRSRTATILERLQKAERMGELPPGTDADSLGDLYATALHGISVQARDGVSKKRLLAMLPPLLSLLESR